MGDDEAERSRRAIGALLRHGTGLGAGCLALGSVLAFWEATRAAGAVVIVASLAVFVALPVGRLLIMLGAFRRAGDRHYTVVTFAVLLLIVLTAVVAVVV
ncbi:hypothetical protein [Stackebrandtia soli]|uniref:hypothetical protein n=1 Tax=Stackebrandtia soli TaxID=1892856 RepID=UPI0039ED4A0F